MQYINQIINIFKKNKIINRKEYSTYYCNKTYDNNNIYNLFR